MNKNSFLISLSESEKTKVGKEDFARQSLPQKVFHASCGAQANVIAELDIYKPPGLREAEAKLLADAKKQYSQPVAQIEAGKGRKLTAEQAKSYLTAAGGDKDKAREAARKDGWEF